jgi:hypothetical protein
LGRGEDARGWQRRSGWRRDQRPEAGDDAVGRWPEPVQFGTQTRHLLTGDSGTLLQRLRQSVDIQPTREGRPQRGQRWGSGSPLTTYAFDLAGQVLQRARLRRDLLLDRLGGCRLARARLLLGHICLLARCRSCLDRLGCAPYRFRSSGQTAHATRQELRLTEQPLHVLGGAKNLAVKAF